MMGRPVLEKQKHLAMFRPSAFYVAQVIMDIPYAIVQGMVIENVIVFVVLICFFDSVALWDLRIFHDGS